jgi:hypothetical protein
LAVGGKPDAMGSPDLFAEGKNAGWGRFSQEYGQVSFRDTLLEDGSTLERTQSMLTSGAKKEIVLQDEELLIRQYHKVTETYLNA